MADCCFCGFWTSVYRRKIICQPFDINRGHERCLLEARGGRGGGGGGRFVCLRAALLSRRQASKRVLIRESFIFGQKTRMVQQGLK